MLQSITWITSPTFQLAQYITLALWCCQYLAPSTGTHLFPFNSAEAIFYMGHGLCRLRRQTCKIGGGRKSPHMQITCHSNVCIYIPHRHTIPFVKPLSVCSQGCQFRSTLQVFDMEILAVGMDVPHWEVYVIWQLLENEVLVAGGGRKRHRNKKE